ncbi:hypothetical protein FB45DRAFT_1030332 [Roridomyces roridus]|uniref:Ribonuclease H1 N-terminal domain-containing protein n=1 Tax=Roridomyces roridus TaxID=1738132 RepID=A0AAD7BNI9_9AGAR|nr:hypothetical protein FB45DRAFT_1030332 [Roridomyces roridus]
MGIPVPHQCRCIIGEERQVLLFPCYLVDRPIVPINLAPHARTLGASPSALDPYLVPNPARCQHCPKPFFRLPSRPDLAFSMFTPCVHGPESQDPNKTVAAMMPSGEHYKTCLGNLVIVKHSAPADQRLSNRDMPVENIVDADIPLLRDMKQDRLGALVSASSYDIPIPGSICRLSAPPPTLSPPPPPPRTPPPPPYGPTSLYRVSSPAGLTYTRDWSEVAHAIRTRPATHVRAVVRIPKHARNCKLFVVFRGRTVGLKNTWAQVQEATSGFRFALFQGYRSRAVAQAAFLHAQQHSWVSTQATLAATPIPAALAPRPLATGVPPPPLSRRESGGFWYLVYVGVNPGIFPTHHECALNVLGIDDAAYDKVPLFAEAHAKFERARNAGQVLAVVP